MLVDAYTKSTQGYFLKELVGRSGKNHQSNYGVLEKMCFSK